MKKQSNKLPGEPTCPHCNKILDGFTKTHPESLSMVDGDLTVCAYCHHLLVYSFAPVMSQGVFNYATVDHYLEIDDMPFNIAEKEGKIIITGLKEKHEKRVINEIKKGVLGD